MEMFRAFSWPPGTSVEQDSGTLDPGDPGITAYSYIHSILVEGHEEEIQGYVPGFCTAKDVVCLYCLAVVSPAPQRIVDRS